MKTLLLSLLLFGHMFAQQPCAQDTLTIIGSPSYATSTATLTLPILSCYDYGCNVNRCHTWQLPPMFSGHVEIQANTTSLTTINIQVWQNCNLVRLDICAPTSDAVRWDTILQFPLSAQLVACAGFVSVGVMIKPGGALDTLQSPFIYTDTLCGAMMPITKPINQSIKTLYEFDGIVWRKVDAMIPNRIYKRW